MPFSVLRRAKLLADDTISLPKELPQYVYTPDGVHPVEDFLILTSYGHYS